MSDDKEGQDASDWLSNQFNPTEQVPKQPPAVGPEPVAPVDAAPAPAASVPAAEPPAEDASAFDWLLHQGSAVSAPAAPTVPTVEPAAVTPPPAAPPPLVQPPVSPAAPTLPSYATPTEPYTPPAGEPTRPLSWDEFAATQADTPQDASAGLAPPTFVDEPTQAYTVQPWEPAAAAPIPSAPIFEPAAASLTDPTDPTSAIDSLFGDNQFQTYEEVGVLQTVQAAPGNDEPRPPRAPLSSTQKTLMGVAAGLIGVLILIGGYFLGQHIGAAQAAAAATSPKGTSTKAPKSAATGGPAAPGVRAWSALQGGECINPFTSAWATTFTVVPCSSDHVAEMVFKGMLSDATGSNYPTSSQLQTELTGLCSASTAINYSAAKSVTDLQVSFSYPPTAAKWQAGDRTYYCFVSRQSNGDITGDLSVPRSGS